MPAHIRTAAVVAVGTRLLLDCTPADTRLLLDYIPAEEAHPPGSNPLLLVLEGQVAGHHSRLLLLLVGQACMDSSAARGSLHRHSRAGAAAAAAEARSRLVG